MFHPLSRLRPDALLGADAAPAPAPFLGCRVFFGVRVGLSAPQGAQGPSEASGVGASPMWGALLDLLPSSSRWRRGWRVCSFQTLLSHVSEQSEEAAGRG